MAQKAPFGILFEKRNFKSPAPASMNYELLIEVLDLLQAFEKQKSVRYEKNVAGFKSWIAAQADRNDLSNAPDWEGKEEGRSPESAISTLLLRLNRYAKAYSKAAILGSDFSTQEDFIYLITLNVHGAMTKMELIKRNVQEKPAGMQIINRLIAAGWIQQTDSETDRRSKVLSLTTKGRETLEAQMSQIRQATQAVSGNLTPEEKNDLIGLLSKLDEFHNPIYCQNIKPEMLLDTVLQNQNKLPRP